MLKKKLLVGGIAVAVAAGLLTLPRVVVDNEGQDNNLESRQDSAPMAEVGVAEGTPHLPEVAEAAQANFAELRKKYKNNENTEKSTIFADSLIAAFRREAWYDSAAFYAEQLMTTSDDPKYLAQTLDLYYNAFTLALDENRARTLGEKVRHYGEIALAEDPSGPRGEV